MKSSLSIVIPAFNEADNLPACLDAIARQSVAPDEVIVVNNNSTDRTAEVAAAYPFVTVISESKQGILHAHRAGFGYAHGKLIARIDAETLLPPAWVETVRSFYDEPGHAATVLAGAGYLTNLRAPWLSGGIMRSSFRFMTVILGHHPLWGPNFVVPASVWQRVGHTTCEEGEFDDLDLALHLHAAGIPIHWNSRLRVGAQIRHCDTWGDFWRYCKRWPQTTRRHSRFQAVASSIVMAVLAPGYYLLIKLMRKPAAT